LLAEKFHINPGLLSRLNPKASLETVGTKIMVPNVSDKAPDKKVDKVVVDKTAKTVRAFDGSKQVTFYPASVGSEERPAPSGERRVRSVTENPTYHYSPKLKFKGVKSKKPLPSRPAPRIRSARRGSISATVTASTARRRRSGSARPNRTAACASQIGTRSSWRKWCTRAPRSSSSIERILAHRRCLREGGAASAHKAAMIMARGLDHVSRPCPAYALERPSGD
jgi:hypothetical protein